MTDKPTLVLKWGTYKGHDNLEEGPMMDALQKYYDYGVSMSAMTQKDEPEQKQALLDLIEIWEGKFYLDWDGEYITKDQAKDYVTNYRN